MPSFLGIKATVKGSFLLLMTKLCHKQWNPNIPHSVGAGGFCAEPSSCFSQVFFVGGGGHVMYVDPFCPCNVFFLCNDVFCLCNAFGPISWPNIIDSSLRSHNSTKGGGNSFWRGSFNPRLSKSSHPFMYPSLCQVQSSVSPDPHLTHNEEGSTFFQMRKLGNIRKCGYGDETVFCT